MNFTPTIFLTQLLAAMQVLMTLDMPLSTTMALPVTSKPIESTVENLAWQAWIELPPEIKQQVKSRKVTPKSIFTLPNRIDCPEGHKQVDTKCIPIVIGTNADLIALNYLSLIAGNSPTDEQYDYDDVMEEELSPLNYGAQMQIGEADKTAEGITQELRPPTKDEPLKFNIFENKFNIYHEEPLEDYSSISNESGGGSGAGSTISDKEIGKQNETLNSTEVNVTAINDLVNNSFNNSKVKTAPILDTLQAESNALTTLADTTADFKIDAISLPASGLDKQLPHKLSIFQTDSSIQLVTTVMDAETEKHSENDIQTLLQTESLLPLINQATATTLLNTPSAESSSLTTLPLEESSSDSEFTLNIEESEEMTTIPNIMEQVMETKDKIEYTRSVTMNPLISDENDSNDDEGKDTTLETIMNDEPLDTTTATTIQLEDTTIIENFETTTTPESLSFEHSSVADSIDLKELLLRQEQAFKDFEELQRMRKGQSEQHTVLKKSKVEPVEVLSATTTTTTTTSTTAMPATLMDELITAETVTPLLTVHNENDNNNDRFYYQHFAKQDLELASDNQRTNSELTPATIKTQDIAAAATTTLSEIEATMPTTITSEIDLAEELRLINELVKGIRPAAATTTTTTTTKIPVTTSSTTTPSTTLETISSLNADIKLSSTYIPPSRESLNSTIKPTLSTSQIWSKIMPLLTTPKEIESSTIQSTSPESSVASSTNDIKTTSELSLITNRSHRNSKIIRINGFNTINSNKFPNSNWSATTTTTTTTTTSTSSTTTTEDPFISSTTPNTNSEDLSSTSDNSYESYWWLPVAWRLDKKPQPEQEVNKEEDQPLLLRFWSAYHAPKSS